MRRIRFLLVMFLFQYDVEAQNFIVPQPQSFEFIVGKTSTYKIRTSIQDNNGVSFTLVSPRTLPPLFSFNGDGKGSMAWSLDKSASPTSEVLRIDASYGGQTKRFQVHIQSIEEPPLGDQNFWQEQCQETLESWNHSSETQSPNEPPVYNSSYPTEFPNWYGIYKPYFNITRQQVSEIQEAKLTGAQKELYDDVVDYTLAIFNAMNLRIPGDYFFNGLSAYFAFVAEDKANAYISWKYNNTIGIGGSPAPTRDEYLRKSIWYAGLQNNIWPPYAPTGTTIPREYVTVIKYNILAFLKSIDSSQGGLRGATLDQLGLLAMISEPLMLEQFLMVPSLTTSGDILTKSKNLLLSKTTPSVACNNSAAHILKQKIPWKQLGMDTYTGYTMFPWIQSKIAQSYYENHETWKAMEMIPVFGTALSIADGMLTFHEGKDFYGQPADRRVTATFLFLDSLEAGFVGAATAGVRGAAKMTKVAQKVKELKLLPRTADGARRALIGTIRELKEVIETVSPSTQAGVCLINQLAFNDKSNQLSRRARLSINADPLPSFSDYLASRIWNKNTCPKAELPAANAAIFDTDIFMHLATYFDPQTRKSMKTEEKILSLAVQEDHIDKAGSKMFMTQTVNKELGDGDYGKLGNPKIEETFIEPNKDKIKYVDTMKVPATEARYVDGAKIDNLLYDANIGDANDRLIVKEVLTAMREGYGDPNASVPLFLSQEENLIIRLAELGGYIFSAKATTQVEKYNELAEHIDGIDLVLSQETIAKALGWNPDRYRDLANLPIKIKAPINTCELIEKHKSRYPKTYEQLVKEGIIKASKTEPSCNRNNPLIINGPDHLNPGSDVGASNYVFINPDNRSKVIRIPKDKLSRESADFNDAVIANHLEVKRRLGNFAPDIDAEKKCVTLLDPEDQRLHGYGMLIEHLGNTRGAKTLDKAAANYDPIITHQSLDALEAKQIQNGLFHPDFNNSGNVLINRDSTISTIDFDGVVFREQFLADSRNNQEHIVKRFGYIFGFYDDFVQGKINADQAFTGIIRTQVQLVREKMIDYFGG